MNLWIEIMEEADVGVCLTNSILTDPYKMSVYLTHKRQL